MLNDVPFLTDPTDKAKCCHWSGRPRRHVRGRVVDRNIDDYLDILQDRLFSSGLHPSVAVQQKKSSFHISEALWRPDGH
jgi:hypothetical protein